MQMVRNSFAHFRAKKL